MSFVLFAVTLKSEFCFPSLKSSVVGEDWVERGRNLFIIATPLKRWRIEESGREGNNNSNSNRKEPEDGAGNYKTATAAAARESLCNRDGVYGGIGVEEEDDQRQVWCQDN